MQFLPTEAYSLTDLITVVFALLGGTFALWQYYKTNKMARGRAAADEVQQFSSDESVKTALRLLEMPKGFISVIDDNGSRQKRPFAAQDFHLALRRGEVKRSEVRTYNPANDLYGRELEKRGEPFEDFLSPTELYVRDVFDAFLGRLERVEMLIECGVISERNFGDVFAYWLKVIGDKKDSGTHQADFSNAMRQTLLEYVSDQEFSGVKRLFARYGKKI